VLTWVNRIVRERIRDRDLFGKWASRWRVIRTSNAYVFRDPRAEMAENRPVSSMSENPPGTLNQKITHPSTWRPRPEPGVFANRPVPPPGVQALVVARWKALGLA
jgi:hypothetical protein